MQGYRKAEVQGRGKNGRERKGRMGSRRERWRKKKQGQGQGQRGREAKRGTGTRTLGYKQRGTRSGTQDCRETGTGK